MYGNKKHTVMREKLGQSADSHFLKTPKVTICYLLFLGHRSPDADGHQLSAAASPRANSQTLWESSPLLPPPAEPQGEEMPHLAKKKSEKLNSLRVLLFLGLRAFAFNKTTRKSPRINVNKIFRLQITHFNLGNGRFLCCYAAFILPFQVYNKFVEFLELNYFSK